MKSRRWLIPFILGLELILVLTLLWAVGNLGTANAAISEATESPNVAPVTWHVCPSGCLHSSIQDAVDAASPTDIIKIATGVYTDVHTRAGLTQVVYISKTVTLEGGYTTDDWNYPDPAANRVILDAGGQGRVVVISGTAISPRLNMLNITGGDATGLGGGAWPGYDSVGGGIYVVTATATIEHCDIYSNVASTAGWAAGGGVYLYRSPSTLTDNLLQYNTASTWTNAGLAGEGGGLASSLGGLILDRNVVFKNIAATNGVGLGGGIYVEASAQSLEQNVVDGNTASLTSRGDGGGIYGTDVTLIGFNNVIIDNICGADGSSRGAGLAFEIAYPTLRHTTLSNNTGGDGSAIYAFGFTGSTVIMTNTIMADHAVGVNAQLNSDVQLDGVLWHPSKPPTSGPGTIGFTSESTGDPLFAGDGYHIRFGSAAVDAGLGPSIGWDIDLDARPQGSGYDLGADELVVVTGTIDQSGGTLIYTDTSGLATIVEAPSSAVSQTITLILAPGISPTYSLPPTLVFANHVFDLDAFLGFQYLPGFQFDKPVTITVHYTDTDIVGIQDDTLGLYYWSGTAWMDGATTCTPPSNYSRDLVQNLLSLPICHLSEWGMMGEPIGENYRVYLPLVLRNP